LKNKGDRADPACKSGGVISRGESISSGAHDEKTHFSPRGQREVGRRKVHLVVTKSGNTMAKIVRKI